MAQGTNWKFTGKDTPTLTLYGYQSIIVIVAIVAHISIIAYHDTLCHIANAHVVLHIFTLLTLRPFTILYTCTISVI